MARSSEKNPQIRYFLVLRQNPWRTSVAATQEIITSMQKLLLPFVVTAGFSMNAFADEAETAKQMEAGKASFMLCAACHGMDAKGVAAGPSKMAPTLIESKTYRHRGHSKSDRNRYRTKEEIEDWKTNRDPISKFEAELMQFGIIDQSGIAAVITAVDAEIAAGIAFAQASPAPATTEVLNDVYTEQN